MLIPDNSRDMDAILAALRDAPTVLLALQTALGPVNPPLAGLTSVEATFVVEITGNTVPTAPVSSPPSQQSSSSSNDDDDDNVAIIVVVVLLAVLLIGLAAGSLYARRRRKEDTDVTLVNPAFVNVGKVHTDKVALMDEDNDRPTYTALKAIELEAACSVGKLPENLPKNARCHIIP